MVSVLPQVLLPLFAKNVSASPPQVTWGLGRVVLRHPLEVSGSAYIRTANTAVSQVLRFDRDQATTGDIGQIQFYTKDGAANPTEYGRITGAATTINNGIEKGDLYFSTTLNGTLAERMRITSTGNVGLGVTPSAWTNSFGVIQGLGGWSISHNGANSNSVDFLSNAYRSGGASTYLYVGSANATRYQQFAGAHQWFNAPSGTAGNPITFTQAMTLDASGNLGIGTSSPARKLHVATAGNNYIVSHNTTASTSALLLGAESGSTAIYSWTTPSSGLGVPLRFVTGATESMRIDTSGNVGIGTVSPVVRLQAETSGAGIGTVARFLRANGAETHAIQFNIDPDTKVSEIRAFGSTNGSLSFATNNTERLRITSTGNVGIGTSSPAATLEISKSSDSVSGPTLRLSNPSSAVDAGVSAGEIEFFKGDLSTGGAGVVSFIKSIPTDLGGQYDLTFGSGTSATVTERLRIDSTGNVGIGTSSPEELFHVSKDASGDVVLGLFENGTNAAGTSASLQLKNNTDVCSTVLSSYRNGADFGADFIVKTANGSDGSLDEVFRITESGNVGIGTSSPASKLHLGGFSGTVNGTNGIRLTNNVGTVVLLEVGSSSDSYIGTSSGSAFGFRTGNTERARIDASGNLLVGTTSTAPAESNVSRLRLRHHYSHRLQHLLRLPPERRRAAHGWRI
jgi:hypothetical protein